MNKKTPSVAIARKTRAAPKFSAPQIKAMQAAIEIMDKSWQTVRAVYPSEPAAITAFLCCLRTSVFSNIKMAVVPVDADDIKKAAGQRIPKYAPDFALSESGINEAAARRSAAFALWQSVAWTVQKEEAAKSRKR